LVLSHYRRGDGGDRGPTRRWIRPQPMQRFDTVNTLQRDVHQNERRLSLVGQVHTLFAGLGHDGLVALDL